MPDTDVMAEVFDRHNRRNGGKNALLSSRGFDALALEVLRDVLKREPSEAEVGAMTELRKQADK